MKGGTEQPDRAAQANSRVRSSGEDASRGPGRPRSVSHERIITAARILLERDGLPGFSMGKLARSVGVSVMALYNYYDGRDAVLDAVAGSIFAEFEMGDVPADWERAFLTWAERFRDLMERHPIAMALIRWDRHIAPSWMRVWLPLLRIIHGQGLRGEALMLTASWASQAAFGLIVGLSHEKLIAATTDFLDHFVQAPDCDPALLEVAPHIDLRYRDTIFDLGSTAIVERLRAIFQEAQG